LDAFTVGDAVMSGGRVMLNDSLAFVVVSSGGGGASVALA
jgi:hypothetical protein